MSFSRYALLVALAVALSGCPQLGPGDEDFSSVMIDNFCGSPIVAELLRTDGTSLGGPITIQHLNDSNLSVRSAVADELPAVTLRIRAEDAVIYSTDKVALSHDHLVEVYMVGTCGPDSTCAPMSEGNAVWCQPLKPQAETTP